MDKDFKTLDLVRDLYIRLKEKYGTDDFLLKSAYRDVDLKRTVGFSFDDISKIPEETIHEYFKKYDVVITYYYEYCSLFGDEIDEQLGINCYAPTGQPLDIWILRNGELGLNATK